MEGTESQPGGDRAKWWTAVVSLAILTVITAVISYVHAYDVFQAAHNTGLLAVLGPVVPDLVIAVCSMALLAAAAAKDDGDSGSPWTAIVALVAFIGVTVALNAVAGLRYGRGSALLAVLAPVGYLTGLHILTRMMRRGRGDGAQETSPATISGEQPSGGPPEPQDTLTALAVLLDTDSERKLAALLRVDRNRVQSWAAMVKQAAEPPSDSRPGQATPPLAVPDGTGPPAGAEGFLVHSPGAPAGANGQMVTGG